MSSKKVFNELALKNVKKSAKDYLIYFFTVTFAVCLFYTFNSLSAQLNAMGVNDTLNYMTAATAALAGVSIFVCLIMGFLVTYANRFLLRRRKREIGIYMTLGMSRKAINRLMMKESTIIGLVSLVVGLLLGLFTSQGLSMISSRVIGVGDGSFHFVLSPIAAISSVIFFGVMFFCVHIFNTRQIKKMHLIDLIYADRKNEVVSGNRIKGALLFIFSLAFMAGGYTVVAAEVTNSFFKNFTIALLLICCGICLFIVSVSDILVPLMKKNKKWYLKGLNMVVISQLGSRLKSAGMSTAVVSMMLFLSVVTMSVGLGIGNSLMADIDKLTPYDASIIWYGSDETSPRMMGQELEKQGAAPKNLGQEAKQINIYAMDEIKDSLIVGQKDYNQAMKLQGQKGVHLSEGQFAVVYSVEKWKNFFENQENASKKSITIDGSVLKKNQNYVEVHNIQNTNVNSSGGIFVVPDQVLKNMVPVYAVLNINLGDGVKDQNQWFQQTRDKLPSGFKVETRENIITEVTSGQIMTTYIGIYLGITFLITAGAVLAIQQLSQSADNRKMYGLMRKMGAGGKELKRSILSQISVYFGLPLGVCIINAGAIIAILFSQIPDLTALIITQCILFSAGLTAVIYGVYFMTTYAGSKQMLKL